MSHPPRPWGTHPHPETVHEVLTAIAHLHDHLVAIAAGLTNLQATAGDGFARATKEIKAMSGTLSEQLDAATAAIQADVAAVAAEVATLLAGMPVGSTISQSQVDSLVAIDTALKAIPAAPVA